MKVRGQPGNGVSVTAVSQQFAQGDVETTSNSLDLAISGSGFFVVSDGGSLQYTRAGAFSTDNNGYVVNSSGQRLQVYAATSDGRFDTSQTVDLQMQTSVSAPRATETASADFNLASNATAPTTATFDPEDSSSYNNATTMTVYDSLGATHSASMYFVKGAAANEWTVHMTVDGTEVGTGATLTYNSSGQLTSPVNGQINFGTYATGTGAEDMDITFDFGDSTQYGNSFSVSTLSQDGYTTGELSSITVDDSGIVQANYTNGEAVALGQVAIATFANQQGLQKVDNTNWIETYGSGQPVYGTAGSSNYGQIQSGALESSNVDLTQELVNMIVAQRNYQANAQMISTEKSITETVINMAR